MSQIPGAQVLWRAVGKGLTYLIIGEEARSITPDATRHGRITFKPNTAGQFSPGQIVVKKPGLKRQDAPDWKAANLDIERLLITSEMKT